MSYFTMERSPQRVAEIEAHWAAVRSGNYEADAHMFKDDISHLIEKERFLARKCIEGAAGHMRHASKLAQVNS